MSSADKELVISAFENARYPSGEPDLENAWLGIYQVLMWYEHGYLHVKESNDLKKSRRWQEKAKVAEARIAGVLGLSVSELPDHMDRMMNLSRWEGKQRNNPLGHGLRYLTAHIMSKWGDPRFKYLEEDFAKRHFPGIAMPGRSLGARVDVLAVDDQELLKAIVSCKWSYRHDRISDVTNECQEYKGAAVKRQNMRLTYYLLTTEFDGQRLDKVISQPCVDGLVHVNLPLAMEVMGKPTELMTAGIAARRLLDLADFIRLTWTW